MGQLLKQVHWGKPNVHSNREFTRTGIIAGTGPLQISMVLRSEESLESEMLSLARTSKYVKNTSMLSISKSEEDSKDRKDSSNLIVIVVIHSYSCFLLDNIVSMQNQL